MAKNHASIESNFVHANINHILLSELERNPQHGYALIALIRKEYQVYLGPSTVYPSLTFLETTGLVRSHWDLGNGRPKKVFMLTEDGTKAVRHQRMALAQIVNRMMVEQ